MTVYILRRLVRGALTVFGVVTISFGILRLGGEPGSSMLPTGRPEDIAALNTALGFDGSILEQYVNFLEGFFLHGTVGDSFGQRMPAIGVVLERMPQTMLLAVTAFAVGLITGLVIAVVLQLTGSQRLRNIFIWLGVARMAIPTFLFGVVLVLVFSVKLGWLPSLGSGSVQHLILPVLTLATFEIALYMRLIDSSLGEQQELDYVRTAHAKGQRRIVVVLRHMLPNALLPALTIAGLNLAGLLGGAVIIENIFGWPGVGSLMVSAVQTRDYPVVQATLLVVAVIFVVVNLLVDLLSALLDPRVRLTS
jgi:peptide/nickel transport system permease protein